MEKGHRDCWRRYNAFGPGPRLPLPSTAQATNLLVAWGQGDKAAFEELMPVTVAASGTQENREFGM